MALQVVKRVSSYLNFLSKELYPISSQRRWLNLQEFASKTVMEKHGLNIQRFLLAHSPEEAHIAAKEVLRTMSNEVVIKAQILAGGRGKGSFDNGFKGGVHLSKDPEAIRSIAEQMLGHRLVTKQTPADGVLVQKLMVAEALDISRETYLCILLDSAIGCPVLVGCAEGGMAIEELAESKPEAILKLPIDINKGLTWEQAQRMAQHLEFEGDLLDMAAKEIEKLYRMFVAVDATQVEINPFVETPTHRVISFDAKIAFDDNAAFRQESVFSLNDVSESDPREVEASKANLNYVAMDGSIGCLVNGAGLAMATMDIIKLHGGSPSNFLDLGGGVTESQVYEAFRLLSKDSQVKAILVNIFGGIVNCATIARGVVKAAAELELKVPIVVRLEGTNVDEANSILRTCPMNMSIADSFDEAARIVCSKVSS